MSLFHVIDERRSAYVIANTYGEAVSKWRHAVATEEDESPDAPDTVMLLARADEVIVGFTFQDSVDEKKDSP